MSKKSKYSQNFLGIAFAISLALHAIALSVFYHYKDNRKTEEIVLASGRSSLSISLSKATVNKDLSAIEPKVDPVMKEPKKVIKDNEKNIVIKKEVKIKKDVTPPPTIKPKIKPVNKYIKQKVKFKEPSPPVKQITNISENNKTIRQKVDKIGNVESKTISSSSKSNNYIKNAVFKGKRLAPKYPKRALRLKLEGTVIIKALIDKKGNVKDIKLMKSSGYKVLDKAVIKVAWKWKFEPSYVNDEAVEQWVKAPYQFMIK